MPTEPLVPVSTAFGEIETQVDNIEPKSLVHVKAWVNEERNRFLDLLVHTEST